MDLSSTDKGLSLVKEGYLDVFKEMLNNGLPLYYPEIKNGKLIRPDNVSLKYLNDILSNEVNDFKDTYIKSFNLTVSDDWAYVIFLMKTAICYVETCSSGGQIKKMVASSNLKLLQAYGDVSHFNGTNISIARDSINYIKITKTKLTASRTPICASDNKIRVVPIAILQLTGDIVKQRLESALWKFKYFKDNGYERDIISTVNKDILCNIYDTSVVESMIGGTGFDAQTLSERGFVRVPEVGASKYDSGVRALNLTKVFEMKQVSVDDVDKRFIDIDLAVVVPSFKDSVNKINDINMLSLICQQLSIPLKNVDMVISVIKDTMYSWVDLSVAYGSTQFLRSLHLYMLNNPMIFMGYSGKRVEFSAFNFNMGVGDEFADNDYNIVDEEFNW